MSQKAIRAEDFTDVTLACYDEEVTQVHEVLLASTNPFTSTTIRGLQQLLLCAACDITVRRSDLPGDYL